MTVADGAVPAVMFAAAYPERTTALVLLNTTARTSADTDYPIGADPDVLEALAAAAEKAWGNDALGDIVAPSMAGDAEYQRWWARYQRMSGSAHQVTAMLRTAFSMDIRPFCPSIKAPTLVLGRKQFVFAGAQMIEHSRDLAHRIPGARLVELEGADGVPQAGDQEAMLEEIEEFLTGVRPQRPAERVLATVLFSDIVGSTQRAVELGDRQWRMLLDQHDAAVRSVVGEYRGQVVKQTGDGFMASFDGPNRAIRCADRLRTEMDGRGITIRTGVHTGEVELREDDLGGVAVHMAARVMGEAQPAEVLVSSTVRDLVAGSGIEFADRGDHALKGIPGEWRLLAVESVPD